MIGKEPTIRDIVLELEDAVQPIDLHCNEEVLEEQVEEEPEKNPFKVLVSCGGGCGSKLRLFVTATAYGIRTFQHVLLSELSILCPECRETTREETRQRDLNRLRNGRF
ncbi:E7 [Macaca fascicularis papillomavirus 2]|uniref:Protein E7 n=1 Tax=Macaca fascicularis papillomavirus 2 TaxID=915424 RepID=F8QPP5_9PAPI|nr:E7 [Macaca fascicularis papillomavirus 2]ADQ39300.1 E7 [Macaca fascicularis papillomavirus 2]